MGIDVIKLRNERKSVGNSIHNQIASACAGNQNAFDSQLTAMNFETFRADKTIKHSECDIETEWFIGRYDIAYADSDGVEVVADFKSRFKRLYLEHKLQLIAYTMARPANMAIVVVPQFHVIPVEIENREPYERLLKNLSSIYYAMKEIGN